MFQIPTVLELMTKSYQGKTAVVRAVTPIPNPQRRKTRSKLLKQTGAAKRLSEYYQKRDCGGCGDCEDCCIYDACSVCDEGPQEWANRRFRYVYNLYMNINMHINARQRLKGANYHGYMHVFLTNGGADYIVFGDMKRSPLKVSHLRAVSKCDLKELHSVMFGRGQCSMTKEELIKELLEVTALDFYSKIYNNRTWHDLDSTYTLTGHSQGDAVKVLILDTLPAKMPAPTKDHLQYLVDDPNHGTNRFKRECKHKVQGLIDFPPENAERLMYTADTWTARRLNHQAVTLTTPTE